MNDRFNILPDPRFLEYKAALELRLASIADRIDPANLGSLLDPLMREVLRQGLAEAQAHEGTLWLLAPDHASLVPAYNTGPNAGRMVGQFAQPLGEGLICMVFASEQPFVENEVARNARQSKLLDNLLQQRTAALMAVPFHLLGACRGVLSCVQLEPERAADPAPRGFRPPHLVSLQRAAVLLSRLLEFHLLAQSIGWSSS